MVSVPEIWKEVAVTENIIELKGLTRRYGQFTAVDSLNLVIEKGEIFGLLCPNGSGTSTLVSILTALLIPIDGTVERSGYDIFGNLGEARQNLAVVFEENILDPVLTGRENLDFHARLHGIPEKARRERIRHVLSRFELTDAADQPVETYTEPMRRRLELARSLLRKPDVLLLSEPTNSLDRAERQTIWNVLKRLNREFQVTIIFSTHSIEETDFLCDRVAVMDAGAIVALDTPETFRAMLERDFASPGISGDS